MGCIDKGIGEMERKYGNIFQNITLIIFALINS
jgi:hypothetical protein